MEFLHNDKKSFAQAVELVVSKQRLRPEIVEKDYYVTMILRLLPLVPQNEEFKNLVRDVRTVREESPVCPSAKEGVDVPSLLKNIIEENAYRPDYNNVTEKLLEDDLKYDDVIVALKTITENGMFA